MAAAAPALALPVRRVVYSVEHPDRPPYRTFDKANAQCVSNLLLELSGKVATVRVVNLDGKGPDTDPTPEGAD